jgi:hypothetical protein
MSEQDLGKRLLPGETEIIRLVRMVDPESKEPIARVELVKKHAELPPLQRRGVANHSFYSLAGFVDWVERWADKSTGTIYYSDVSVKLVMDERAEVAPGGKVETVYYEFDFSDEWKLWTRALGINFSHRELLNHFRKNSLDIVNAADLLDGYGKIKTNVHLEHLSESDSKDGRKLGVQFSSKTGSTKAEAETLPGVLVLEIPVFMDDDLAVDENGEPTRLAQLDVKISIEEPESPGESVNFVMTCPEWEKVKRARIREEIAKLESRLCDWLIVAGKPEFKL